MLLFVAGEEARLAMRELEVGVRTMVGWVCKTRRWMEGGSTGWMDRGDPEEKVGVWRRRIGLKLD